MSIELRPITPDEFPLFWRAGNTAFGELPNDEQKALSRALFEVDRSLAAIDTEAPDALNRIVGTAAAYSFELTLPGETTLPVGGVTAVGVLPTHRRRGILTALMRRQLDDIQARGEAVAILTASESAIYGRFGYGLATSRMNIELDRRHAAFTPRAQALGAEGRVAFVSQEDAAAILPAIYDRVRRRQPGALTRSPARWNAMLHNSALQADGFSPHFYVTYTSPAGEREGAAYYRIKQNWEQGVPASTVVVDELFAATPGAFAALWRYVLSLDLVQTIQAMRRPLDEPLRWLLADPRRLRPYRIGDDLWVRLLDIPTALAARRYGATDSLVFEVADPFRPQTAGRYQLETGADAPLCLPTDAAPDLALDVADLGAAYLGGVSFTTLARAGRVAERAPGALARADALFASNPAPFCGTPF